MAKLDGNTVVLVLSNGKQTERFVFEREMAEDIVKTVGTVATIEYPKDDDRRPSKTARPNAR